MNEVELKGKWNQIKGTVQEKWGELSDDIFHQIDGNYDQLVAKLQEFYNITKEEAEKQINELKDDTK